MVFALRHLCPPLGRWCNNLLGLEAPGHLSRALSARNSVPLLEAADSGHCTGPPERGPRYVGGSVESVGPTHAGHETLASQDLRVHCIIHAEQSACMM